MIEFIKQFENSDEEEKLKTANILLQHPGLKERSIRLKYIKYYHKDILPKLEKRNRENEISIKDMTHQEAQDMIRKMITNYSGTEGVRGAKGVRGTEGFPRHHKLLE
tara:strand:- start:67136 stop:67456 length:321 start_codon:yes stop_codon:yes gene_type:complete